MKKTLLLIVCALCVLLCACTPYESAAPESTPAPTDPKPTPGMVIIAPVGTPDDDIDDADPDDVDPDGADPDDNTQGEQGGAVNPGNTDQDPDDTTDDTEQEFELPILPG